MPTHRRDFLKYLGWMILTPYTLASESLLGVGKLPDAQTDFIFPLSIASGDPSPNAVVLWTRVNPDAIEDQAEPLLFEVARDRNFAQVVYTGRVEGHTLQAERDFTVSIDLAEQAWANLEPHSSYYYRFSYRGISSRIGHCRTLPSPEQTVESLRFVQISCQDYSSGYYHAFAHIAQEKDVDFVVHLGDFIYEFASFPSVDRPPRKIQLPGEVALSLEDYRSIYRQYRRDPNLQRAMENHTWIITADDHEIANNYYWDYKKDTLGLPEGRHPLSDASDQEKTTLMLAAQRAWVEYVPARIRFDAKATHPWQCLSIYRRFRFGKLAELHMTDTRTYRSDPAVEGSSPTMLGAAQKDWLISGIQKSDAAWQIWGNQTLFSQFGILERLSGKNLTLLGGKDAWDGFPDERRSVLQAIRSSVAGRLLVLTGDMHTYLSSFVKIDYNQASNHDPENVLGLELMTPAISSPNLPELLIIRAKIADARGNAGLKSNAFRKLGELYAKGDLQARLIDANLKFVNPHIEDFGGAYNGYTLVKVRAEQVSWQVYHVDRRASTLDQAPKTEVRAQSYALKDRSIA